MSMHNMIQSIVTDGQFLISTQVFMKKFEKKFNMLWSEELLRNIWW